ncbi:alpha/beta fold hydrolase [Streptomyces sp. CC224B]|uniref:thioesterase II family protein n=1 Tax=Streptomyces sp. CC224B TaxID=3044571 RepID=UPI0024A8FECB|nr:alpha/beta fold hydrolase [Streptomyces sp. CC224B]
MTTAAADLWLRSYHPAPDATRRLVCFPHAGGSASFYFPVSAALSPVADVVALQYPGRQDRHTEKGVETVAELADRITDALRGHTDLPLTFFGHSMGAVLAFEVARRLERAGQAPAHVFASGRRAPSRYRPENVHQRDDDGVIAEMRKLSGTDPRILGDDEVLRMVLPAIRSDYTAIETYRAEPGAQIGSPITVLVGDDDPRTTLDEARAWEPHTLGAFDMKVFPGGHFYLTDHAQDVIAVLKEHLTS